MTNILKKYNIKAKKSLGQNFLVDENILQVVIDTVEVTGKNIIEVWPGYGALTEKICEKHPKSLTLVELDTDMIEILKDRVQNNDFLLENTKFEIQNIDVLQFEPELEDYQVLANIPYYITSPILRHFLYDVKNTAKSMLILMQKDVGDKILQGQNTPLTPPLSRGKIKPQKVPLLAKEEKTTPPPYLPLSGGGIEQQISLRKVWKNKKLKTSVLSLFISKKMYVKEVAFVSNTAFVPAPKVDSSFLYFESHNLYNETDDGLFLSFIKKAFSSPRKKLSKNLESAGYNKQDIKSIFQKLELGQNIRPENVDVAWYCELVWEFHKEA